MVTGRRGQPEPEGGNCSPREALSTKLQAGFGANQDFMGFWTINIHLRRDGDLSPPQLDTFHPVKACQLYTQKTSGREGGGDKSQGPHMPNNWSPELLRPGKSTKRRPNQVCAFEEYLST